MANFHRSTFPKAIAFPARSKVELLSILPSMLTFGLSSSGHSLQVRFLHHPVFVRLVCEVCRLTLTASFVRLPKADPRPPINPGIV